MCNTFSPFYKCGCDMTIAAKQDSKAREGTGLKRLLKLFSVTN